MASNCLRTSIWIFCALLAVQCRASPAVAFPFNSQVPTVPRVGEDYHFEFSTSTFIPDASNFTYSLSDQPSWLSLDSPTRTLSGVPSSADAGANNFTITAADETGAAHMSCTLVVSTDPAPQMEWSISEQLAATTNLSSSQPPTVTILPTTPFHFEFRQDSFIDTVQRKLTYYATLADHTPLPSWLTFDRAKLKFSGTAPILSAFPQSWEISLIASDVEGFGGAATFFTLAIGTQQLVFVPERQKVNITAGSKVEANNLGKTLFLNGKNISPGALKSAQASTPSWLTLDSDTLAMSGTVPSPVTDFNVTVTVVDDDGFTAAAIVTFSEGGNSSFFTGSVPTMTAYYGETFSYRFPDSLFTESDLQLMVTLPGDAKWLHFDSSTHILSGTVPDKTDQKAVEGTLTVKADQGSAGQSQGFTIDLQTPIPKSTICSSSVSTMSPTPSSEPTPLEPILPGSRHHLSTGAVAGIIVGTVTAAALVAVLLVFCWRRKRKNDSYVENSPDKRIISRPIPPPDAATISVTTDLYSDVEKQAGGVGSGLPMEEWDLPPQIALDLPAHPATRRMKWSKRFSRISQVSSIGNGEDAIRADPNVPEWGTKTTALHTPHHSFSVPAEIARSSRLLSDQSPSRRALKRLRKKRQSEQSIGLGIDTGGDIAFPRHTSNGSRVRKRGPTSVSHHSRRDRSSMASFSTRGTSVLSTKPSDFPRPPSSADGPAWRKGYGLTESEKRRSIRLVAPSESTLDHRSMQEKRQSFIRNRASTSLASPLFAHGSRAPSDPRLKSHSSVRGSVAGSRRSGSQLTNYSESSSLEPPPRNPKRLSARMRSAFQPSFPRAITASTMGADDEAIASSAAWSTASSSGESDLAAQLARPRSQRNFVLPGEASPTPPPLTASPTSRAGSSARKTTSRSEDTSPRHKWEERPREHASSPLSTAVAVSVESRDSPSAKAGSKGQRRSLLGEPLSLVSSDSLSRSKLERPRLVQHTSSKRPVSVEKVQRFSSLKAEPEDARPGSEMWEAMEGAGLMPRSVADGREGTQRSNMSGPAFI